MILTQHMVNIMVNWEEKTTKLGVAQQPRNGVSRIWQSDDVYEKCDDISIVNGFLQEGTETEETGHRLGQAAVVFLWRWKSSQQWIWVQLLGPCFFEKHK